MFDVSFDGRGEFPAGFLCGAPGRRLACRPACVAPPVSPLWRPARVAPPVSPCVAPPVSPRPCRPARAAPEKHFTALTRKMRRNQVLGSFLDQISLPRGPPDPPRRGTEGQGLRSDDPPGAPGGRAGPAGSCGAARVSRVARNGPPSRETPPPSNTTSNTMSSGMSTYRLTSRLTSRSTFR